MIHCKVGLSTHCISYDFLGFVLSPFYFNIHAALRTLVLRFRARARLIEEDAETEASYGSHENSGTESSVHGDESSNLGEIVVAIKLFVNLQHKRVVEMFYQYQSVICFVITICLSLQHQMEVDCINHNVF